MGCGEHLLVVGAEPQDEQRLRKVVRNERSVQPRGDDTADGEASGAQMRLFRRFQKRCSRKPRGSQTINGYWKGWKHCTWTLPPSTSYSVLQCRLLGNSDFLLCFFEV